MTFFLLTPEYFQNDLGTRVPAKRKESDDVKKSGKKKIRDENFFYHRSHNKLCAKLLSAWKDTRNGLLRWCISQRSLILDKEEQKSSFTKWWFKKGPFCALLKKIEYFLKNEHFLILNRMATSRWKHLLARLKWKIYFYRNKI